MRILRRLSVFLAGIVLCLSASAQAGDDAAADRGSKPRMVAVISDLHMGIGRKGDGTWWPTEDFRWPRAFEGFLDFVSQKGDQAVDLVIAGDMFELWQPPAHITCAGASADLGCTVDEMAAIAEIVAHQHAQELTLLADFAAQGGNRVYLIPGNHDAALLLDPVWQKFAGPLRASEGRVSVVRSGVWASADGFVVVEHGHQIGADVNRYADWPQIVRSENGTSYVVRPWGERFVQRVFNEQEARYPIVDNLSPESAGVRYRMSDRGVWGTAADLARFLAFNIFETSAEQKAAVLGPPPSDRPMSDAWVMAVARKSGHKLFAGALAQDDPFRVQLMMTNDAQAAALRKELDLLAADEGRMSVAEIKQMCDLAAANAKDGWQLCRPVELGSAIEAAIFPLESILREHLKSRTAKFKDMRVFVYGHTHKIQAPQQVAVSGTVGITVANTGAFQRLVDEKGFLRRAKDRSWTAAEALRRMTPEDLPPCYGAVLVSYDNGRPVADVGMWSMTEDGSSGSLVRPGNERCR